jgi:hypothetical protein
MHYIPTESSLFGVVIYQMKNNTHMRNKNILFIELFTKKHKLFKAWATGNTFRYKK